MNINTLGFMRVGAASPKLKVADCEYNTAQIKQVIDQAITEQVQVLCFPELCITSYSCGDLFYQKALLDKAVESLLEITRYLEPHPSLIAIVGLPLQVRSDLYNTAAVISHEGILGFAFKNYLPNHDEFYERRWFRPASDMNASSIRLGEYEVSISSAGTIFSTPFGSFGVEICEDLWAPFPPSTKMATRGAEVIFNLSASNELVGKHAYRKSLVEHQSAKCHAAYVYASAGTGESTTDLVFSGSCLIAENGRILAESERFSLEGSLVISDIDREALRHDRLKNSNFHDNTSCDTREVACAMEPITVASMHRVFSPHPFIPSDSERENHLSEVFNIQAHGLVKRLTHTGIKHAVIGVSGGLDSTLALLVTLHAFDLLGLPRKNIHGITMPGLGTTSRTYTNGMKLMEHAGISSKEISIVEAINQHFKDIEQDSDLHDVTYENSQARERTQVLMDWANKVNGLVIGTGNMSELALGWATYNGDHMSMYAVNTGVPKTLVATLTRWIADTRGEESLKNILHDILDTPFSPELLPPDKEGKIAQETEHFVGPYELHDFFLYRVLRYGDTPERVQFIAGQAFGEKYAPEVIAKWLNVFYKRFFSQQFKRSCLPDGPKVGSVNLSPRGDWRMPSDASDRVWRPNPLDSNNTTEK